MGEWELNIIRERAHQLRDGTLRSRGEALLPINLAGFILDALIMPSGLYDFIVIYLFKFFVIVWIKK